jgi:hypothetical protein
MTRLMDAMKICAWGIYLAFCGGCLWFSLKLIGCILSEKCRSGV